MPKDALVVVYTSEKNLTGASSFRDFANNVCSNNGKIKVGPMRKLEGASTFSFSMADSSQNFRSKLFNLVFDGSMDQIIASALVANVGNNVEIVVFEEAHRATFEGLATKFRAQSPDTNFTITIDDSED